MQALKVLAIAGIAAATIALATDAIGAGADIVYSGLGGGINTYGPTNVPAQGGNVYAYVLGSNTCNIGDAPLAWNNTATPLTPGLIMNAYRLANGRLEQIGTGHAKTACCVGNSLNASLCMPVCSSGPTSTLHAGCMDTYSAGWNDQQNRLAPRSTINPTTGVFSSITTFTSTAIGRRVQVKQADMSATTYPGALYFAEGQYICTEDAQNGNWANNASYSRVTINPTTYAMAATGAFYATRPAIYAWQDHGGGANVVDADVVIQNVDIPGEGRYIVGSKVKQTGRNTWHYEYAIQNFNSNRAAQSFRVPLPAGAIASNSGFHDAWYHDDDAIYDGTDWNMPVSAFEQRWSCTQTVTQNPNANALRWGTLYNFWFDSNRPPVAGHGEIDLFKAAVGCQPATVRFALNVPGADCDADVSRNGVVDADDLQAVISGWGVCSCVSNCPANIDKTNNNVSVDADDLLRVISTWGGCP